jgi:hypothetical protein
MPEKGLALNYSHEYQIVFIEPSDGTHLFRVQLGKYSSHLILVALSLFQIAYPKLTGSPFTDPTGTIPAPNAHSFKILDHSLNVLFTTPSNVAQLCHPRRLGQLDAAGVLFDSDAERALKAVTGVVQSLLSRPEKREGAICTLMC